ncbi:type 1 fimbrial protein [Cronobacter turicensis]|nr:type 1 fimbrial protein [Cronobacter turicensis]EKY3210984.1 type 1 fimbrial protein [Cronobacter turicensis]EKY3217335.1 type 1 fimbrial protein [Cronobacter turicensis]
MKLLSSGVIISSLFMATGAYAEVTAPDTPATITISGTTTSDQEAFCTLTAGVKTLDLRGNAATLIEEGDVANNTSYVTFHIGGNAQCDALIEQGQLSYRFLGAADDSQGNALANASTGENSASGVAIGLFDYLGNPVSINAPAITATKATLDPGIGFQIVKLKDRTVTPGTVHGVLTIEVERL